VTQVISFAAQGVVRLGLSSVPLAQVATTGRPGSKARGKARRTEDCEEEIQEHYVGLTSGLRA